MKDSSNQTAHICTDIFNVSLDKMELDLCDSFDRVELSDHAKSEHDKLIKYFYMNKSCSDSEDTRDYLDNKHLNYLQSHQTMEIDAVLSNTYSHPDNSNLFTPPKHDISTLDENSDENSSQLKRYYSSWDTYESQRMGLELSNDSIPKAIIQRTLLPEKITNGDRKKDIAELISKLGCSQPQKNQIKNSVPLDQDIFTSDISCSTAHDRINDSQIMEPIGVEPTFSFEHPAHAAIDLAEKRQYNPTILSYNAIMNGYSEDNAMPIIVSKFTAGLSMYDSAYQSQYEDLSFHHQIPYIDAPNCSPYLPSSTPFTVSAYQRPNFFNYRNPQPFTMNNLLMNKQHPYVEYPLPINLTSKIKPSSHYKDDQNSPEFVPHSRAFVQHKLSPNGSFLQTDSENIEFDSTKSTLELAKDQHGSRLIQQKIESASRDEVSHIIRELTADQKEFVTLMGDVFGNYVIQKLLDFGFDYHRISIASCIKGYVLELTLQMYGCRVIQKAIECVPLESQVIIVKELHTHVLECIKDQNGNHVIQKCIERLEPARLSFIISEIAGHILILATHPYGCRVIQRVMEYFDMGQKSIVTEELFINLPLLICDQYGNYVVQHILDHSSLNMYRDRIFSYVKDNLFYLSCHKFASNVVEKCLTCGTKGERSLLACEIITKSTGSEDDIVFKMMKDAYANYVIQKLLDVLIADKEYDLFFAFVSKIKPHYPNLRKINYGKHIISKIDKICANVSPRYNLPYTNGKGKINTNISEYLPKRNHHSHHNIHNDHLFISGDYSQFHLNEEYIVAKSNSCKSIILDSLTEFPCLTRDATPVSTG